MLLKGAGLRVRAVQDGEVTVVAVAVADLLRDLADDLLSLIEIRRILRDTDQVALVVVGPERLGLAAEVVFDHLVGGVQDAAGGAVVLLELDHLRVGIGLLKIQYIADVGAAEAVNGLVVITDDTEIVLGFALIVDMRCQQTDQLKLCRVRVLVLIHENMLKTVLIIGQSLVVGAEHLHGLHQQVVKIKRVVLAQEFLVFRVCPCDVGVGLAADVRGAEVLGTNQLVLRLGDRGKHLLRRELLDINVEMPQNIPHGALLIVRVIDHKILFVSETGAEPAEHAHARGVEGADPDVVKFIVEESGNTFLHLVGGLVCKCDRKNTVGAYAALTDQVRDAVRDHPGLARACACKDEKRPLFVEYGL